MATFMEQMLGKKEADKLKKLQAKAMSWANPTPKEKQDLP